MEQARDDVVDPAIASMEKRSMALNVTPVPAGMIPVHQPPIAVEISDRRLPLRMRLDALRASRIPRTGFLRRMLEAPGTAVSRLLSR